MPNTWETAREKTLQTCGPEINADAPLKDTTTQGAFDKAMKYITKKVGIFETKTGKLNDYGKVIEEALKNRGKNACSEIAQALDSTSYKTEIPKNLANPNIPAVSPKNTSDENQVGSIGNAINGGFQSAMNHRHDTLNNIGK